MHHYVAFNPRKGLIDSLLEAYSLKRGVYKKRPRSDVEGDVDGLVLTFCKGEYVGQVDTWLRWYDEKSDACATAVERIGVEAIKADEETLSGLTW